MNRYQMMDPRDLRPNRYNPNVIDVGYAALVAELRGQGRVLKPVVARLVDGATEIVDGEHTCRAAIDAGLSEVPVELVELDEFEARRETLVRNRTGAKDNLKLGRVYRDMLAERDMSNIELAKVLGLSEGTVRNQLQYADCWDLLVERGTADAGCYVWRGIAYTEPTIAKMGIRDVRALIASLRSLEDDEEADVPGAAEAETRILARLKRAWNKASDEERGEFLEWTGALAPLQRELAAARRDLQDVGAAMEQHRATAKPEPEAPQHRNGYDGDDDDEVRQRLLAFLGPKQGTRYANMTGAEFAQHAGLRQPPVSSFLNGKTPTTNLKAKIVAALEKLGAQQVTS